MSWGAVAGAAIVTVGGLVARIKKAKRPKAPLTLKHRQRERRSKKSNANSICNSMNINASKRF